MNTSKVCWWILTLVTASPLSSFALSREGQIFHAGHEYTIMNDIHPSDPVKLKSKDGSPDVIVYLSYLRKLIDAKMVTEISGNEPWDDHSEKNQLKYGSIYNVQEGPGSPPELAVLVGTSADSYNLKFRTLVGEKSLSVSTFFFLDSLNAGWATLAALGKGETCDLIDTRKQIFRETDVAAWNPVRATPSEKEVPRQQHQETASDQNVKRPVSISPDNRFKVFSEVDLEDGKTYLLVQDTQLDDEIVQKIRLFGTDFRIDYLRSGTVLIEMPAIAKRMIYNRPTWRYSLTQDLRRVMCAKVF